MAGSGAPLRRGDPLEIEESGDRLGAPHEFSSLVSVLARLGRGAVDAKDAAAAAAAGAGAGGAGADDDAASVLASGA